MAQPWPLAPLADFLFPFLSLNALVKPSRKPSRPAGPALKMGERLGGEESPGSCADSFPPREFCRFTAPLAASCSWMRCLLVTEPISFSCFSDSQIKVIEEREKNNTHKHTKTKQKLSHVLGVPEKYSHVGDGAAKLLTRSLQ